MSKMVERVARAINETANRDYWAYNVDRDVSFALARAAIAAMREPPTSAVFGEVAIIIRLADAAPRGMLSYEGAGSIARELWRAMIDAGVAGGLLDTPEGAKRLFDEMLALAAVTPGQASPDPSHN